MLSSVWSKKQHVLSNKKQVKIQETHSSQLKMTQGSMLCLGFQSTVCINSKQKQGITMTKLKLMTAVWLQKRISCLGALGGRGRLNWKLHATIPKHVTASSRILWEEPVTAPLLDNAGLEVKFTSRRRMEKLLCKETLKKVTDEDVGDVINCVK